jgi:GntR family transcriptional regulator
MHFEVDTASSLPIYRQLVHQAREAIARGDLQPEDRLPSVRQLSQELVINPNTVARAYMELEREGVLISRSGRGIYVARPATELTKGARDRRLEKIVDRLLTEAVHLGFAPQEVVKLVAKHVKEFQWNTVQSG